MTNHTTPKPDGVSGRFVKTKKFRVRQQCCRGTGNMKFWRFSGLEGGVLPNTCNCEVAVLPRSQTLKCWNMSTLPLREVSSIGRSKTGQDAISEVFGSCSKSPKPHLFFATLRKPKKQAAPHERGKDQLKKTSLIGVLRKHKAQKNSMPCRPGDTRPFSMDFSYWFICFGSFATCRWPLYTCCAPSSHACVAFIIGRWEGVPSGFSLGWIPHCCHWQPSACVPSSYPYHLSCPWRTLTHFHSWSPQGNQSVTIRLRCGFVTGTQSYQLTPTEHMSTCLFSGHLLGWRSWAQHPEPPSNCYACPCPAVSLTHRLQCPELLVVLWSPRILPKSRLPTHLQLRLLWIRGIRDIATKLVMSMACVNGLIMSSSGGTHQWPHASHSTSLWHSYFETYWIARGQPMAQVQGSLCLSGQQCRMATGRISGKSSQYGS